MGCYGKRAVLSPGFRYRNRFRRLPTSPSFYRPSIDDKTGCPIGCSCHRQYRRQRFPSKRTSPVLDQLFQRASATCWDGFPADAWWMSLIATGRCRFQNQGQAVAQFEGGLAGELEVAQQAGVNKGVGCLPDLCTNCQSSRRLSQGCNASTDGSSRAFVVRAPSGHRAAPTNPM